jgi:cathepsin L
VETIESFVAINTGILTEVSQQELVSCMPNDDECGGTGGCEGATAELAFDYLAEYGLAEVWTYGYLPETYWFSYTNSNGACLRDTTYGGQPAVPRVVKASGYTLLERNSYSAVMNAVANIGPVAINIDASNWHSYESGVFSGCPQTDVDINHVVQLVGYGTDVDTGLDYWLVRNSWSPEYGEEGYIRLERSAGYCGIDYHNGDGVGCNYDPTNVTVCGMCGILYDVSFPNGAGLV